MHLAAIHASGAEEWRCGVCGRRLLIQWPPEYALAVLAAGQAKVLHVFVRGGLYVQPDQLTEMRANALADAWRLRAWDHWLADIDFSGLPVEDTVHNGAGPNEVD
jgi:hypothetical protein